MATDGPDRPALGPLLVALRVERNLRVGLAAGAGLAILLFAYRVVLIDPAAGAITSPWLLGALAVVLAVAAGGLIAIVLTVATAIARIRAGE